MPKVSIGMPVYNGERFLAETLDSLLAQSFEDFELIICDNASEDRTEEICSEYASRDRRIRYSRNTENVGAANNYRLALELSVGEYFRWANCDDLFAPEGLQRCVDVLDQEPTVVLTYPKTKLIDERGEILSEYEDRLDLRDPKASERFKKLMFGIGLVNVIYGLMRADILRQTGLLRNFPGGDIPLLAELTLYGKFWEIPEFLFFRRFHAGALSSSKEDVAATQEFFDPKTKGRIPFTEWKHLGAHFGSVIRAPVTMSEKTQLGLFLLRKAVWYRTKLWNEVFGALRQVIHRVSFTSR